MDIDYLNSFASKILAQNLIKVWTLIIFKYQTALIIFKYQTNHYEELQKEKSLKYQVDPHHPRRKWGLSQ